ncbi:MAG: type IV toxin-antitoxin system AbiEi family antitoxin [Flammeovirgaceae bacterium]
MEQEIIQKAIENLQKNGFLKAKWKNGKDHKLDGEMDILVEGKPLHFFVEVKQELRNHHLTKIFEQAHQWKNLLVIANTILPGIKEELRQRHICYLEGNGNIFIERQPFFIWLDQNKPLPRQKEKPNRAFAKTGLQVVFLFLNNPEYINKPYRAIAKAADTALGNVNNIINGLIELGFLVRKNKDELILHNTKALLDKWVIAYEEKLKPALHVGNFRFTGTNADKNWKALDLPAGETVWGGEPGGDILTNHLRPEILTIYTNEPNKDLMTRYKIVPDNLGQLKVYKKFWENLDLKKTKAAPPILVYADLINTNEKRCVETAQKIYEQYIEPNL